MVVTKYEQVKAKTAPVEAAFYGLLEHIDEYRELLEALIAEDEAAEQPNAALVKRFRQFIGKATSMTKILEDDVLTEMLWLLDRLHAVKDTEEGTFI